jgi:hypothetical protein
LSAVGDRSVIVAFERADTGARIVEYFANRVSAIGIARAGDRSHGATHQAKHRTHDFRGIFIHGVQQNGSSTGFLGRLLGAPYLPLLILFVHLAFRERRKPRYRGR